MTNTAEARELAIERMRELVSEVEGVAATFLGDIRTPYEAKVACLVYLGDEKEETFANVMVRHRWNARVYWPIANLRQEMAGEVEMDMFHTSRDIQEKLRGDSQLSGYVSDLKIGDAETQYLELGENVVCRVLTIPVDLWELEAEAISA